MSISCDYSNTAPQLPESPCLDAQPSEMQQLSREVFISRMRSHSVLKKVGKRKYEALFEEAQNRALIHALLIPGNDSEIQRYLSKRCFPPTPSHLELALCLGRDNFVLPILSRLDQMPSGRCLEFARTYQPQHVPILNQTIHSLFMHYINTTPAFLKLYQTAEREAQRFGNSLTIRVLSPDEVPWGGACHYARGEIWLSEGRDSTSDFLIMAIFELANMVQAQKFHALGVRLAKGTIGREGYARAMEAIERISQKIHAKVFAIAAVQEQDPRRAELFIQCAAYYLEANQETEEQDFERNKANGHAEPYYQHWDLCISMEALVEYYPDEISHVVQMPNRETEFFEYVV